jgi:cation:H+ antiporter
MRTGADGIDLARWTAWMRNVSLIVAAGLATVPGLALEWGVYAVADAPLRALILGVAIVGAAFLLSWSAEVVQMDVSQGLALGLLALIAVLPEYIVDATFAWKAARDPAYSEYAVANMTGANRILIGVAWPMVVLLGWLRWRRPSVELQRGHGLELLVLLAATLYAASIPFTSHISLIDCAVLGAIFLFYVWRLSKMPAVPPHLVGPAETIAALPTAGRRALTIGLVISAAVTVIYVAEAFADALIETGGALGIDEFLLVQWLAPLASEAPEFVVVGIFAWRGATGAAMATLVSSKINQWTLLVGMLPLVYSISLGKLAPLPLTGRQDQEVLLTVAQTLFAVLIMLDLRLHWHGALVLFGLFLAGFIWPTHHAALSAVYMAMGIVAAVLSRRQIVMVLGHTTGRLRRRNPPAAAQSGADTSRATESRKRAAGGRH